MQSFQSFKELKATARKSLEGNYGRAIFMFISVELFNLIPTYTALLLFSGNNIFNIVGSEIVGFIMSVFLQVLQPGLCFFYMKMYCKQPTSTSDLFWGYREHTNKALKIGLTFATISYLSNLPAIIFSYVSNNLYVAYCLLMGGIILNFIITVPIKQSFYILLDFPDLSAKQTLIFSIRIMRKNFLRYVLLTLTFVPLILLSFLCCGVGLLWVIPYTNATLTVFYFDLVKNYNTSKATN